MNLADVLKKLQELRKELEEKIEDTNSVEKDNSLQILFEECNKKMVNECMEKIHEMGKFFDTPSIAVILRYDDKFREELIDYIQELKFEGAKK